MSLNTYNIGDVKNDLLHRWKSRGYQVTDRGGRTVLVKQFEQEEPDVLQNARERLEDTRQELEELQEQLQEKRGRLQEVGEEIADYGFETPPPLPSTESVEQLPEDEQQRVEELLSEWGHLSNIIGGIRDDIRSTRGELGQLSQTVEELEEQTKKEHLVPVVTVSYDVMVVGIYEPTNTGEIGAEGRKKIETGIEPPLNVDEDQFWEDAFEEIRNEILENPPKPDGEWYERLKQLEEFSPGTTGQFIVESAGDEQLWNWAIQRGGPFTQDEGGDELGEQIERTAERKDLSPEVI